MKSVLVAIVASATCALAGAQDYGRVLSSTPVIQQVAVPQQVCHQESVVVPGQRYGAGAAIGAIAGAAIGNSIGHGGGRAAGTLIGMIGGAAIGDQIEGQGANQIQQVRQCTTHTAYESRVLYYDVVYAYAGRQYAAQMAQDPGPTVQLQVSPVGAAAPPPVNVAAPIRVAPTVTTIHSSVEYVPYIAPVRVAPIVIALPLYRQLHPQRQHRHPYRAATPYQRHPGQGQAPYWR